MSARARTQPPSPAAPEELSFEACLARLETLVARLEQGDLALEAALAAFEEGVALSRRCATQLEQAERRIEKLARDGGVLTTRRLEPGESAS